MRYGFRLQVIAACDRDATVKWGAYRKYVKDEVSLYRYRELQGQTVCTPDRIVIEYKRQDFINHLKVVIDAAQEVDGLVLDKELVKVALETRNCKVCFIPPCFGSKTFYQLSKQNNVPLIDTMTKKVLGKLIGRAECDSFVISDYGEVSESTLFIDQYLSQYYTNWKCYIHVILQLYLWMI